MRQQQARHTDRQQPESDTSKEGSGRHQGQARNVKNLHGGPFQ